MSESFTSNPSTFGKEIEIIRQRFFIDYTSTSDKYFSEEYTIRCLTVNLKGIDNIFLKSPKLLPNLKIFDSDGTQLALITNKLTKALLNTLIKNSTEQNVIGELSKLRQQMSAQEIFLLWIKLPSNRKLMPKEARVITLEYDSPKEDSDKKDKVLEFHSAPYEVFYTIQHPEDYEFDKEEFEIYENDGTKLKNKQNSWKKESKKEDPFYYNENKSSVSIRVNPNIADSIKFIYSFKVKQSVTALPVLTLSLLILASVVLFMSNYNLYTDNCSLLQICFDFSIFQSNQAQIGIGIIGGSLIIPNLIKNPRNSKYTKVYLYCTCGDSHNWYVCLK